MKVFSFSGFLSVCGDYVFSLLRHWTPLVCFQAVDRQKLQMFDVENRIFFRLPSNKVKGDLFYYQIMVQLYQMPFNNQIGFSACHMGKEKVIVKMNALSCTLVPVLVEGSRYPVELAEVSAS